MNELERQIGEEIRAGGTITFARFMELALYHPALGYYSRPRDPFGAGGDYYTNSQLQPVFGRLIAQQIAEWKARLDDPPHFTVVELGAGRGETAREVRARLPAIGYEEVERSTGGLPVCFAGVVFSNEFFDALPVHVARFSDAGWTETVVGLEGEKLVWMDRGLSSPALESYLQSFVPSPAPGQIAEVNLHALEWLDRIAQSLERGFVLTIDYGYTARETLRFPEGSLMSYRRHRAYQDVLAAPGQRDVTAHVNFTALVQHGESLGLQASPLMTQAEFLLSIGRADEFQSALAASSEPEAHRHRMLLKTLLYGMGETFRVLIQEKHAR